MDFTFEIISHRFTSRARSNILAVFPQTDLPMDENNDRRYKYGQFGYGKYVYTKEKLEQMKAFFKREIARLFPQAVIDYLIWNGWFVILFFNHPAEDKENSSATANNWCYTGKVMHDMGVDFVDEIPGDFSWWYGWWTPDRT